MECRRILRRLDAPNVNIAFAHLVSPVSPLVGFIGRHPSPDEIDVVGEKTERKRPGESRKQPNAEYGDAANGNRLYHDSVEILAEALEAQRPWSP